MSEVGLIMLGFGIAMLGTIIFILLVCFVAGDGLGLVFELTFFFLAFGGGIGLMLYAKDAYAGMVIDGLVVGGLIVFQYVNLFKKTKGLKGKEREAAIKRDQQITRNSYLVGCDSVTEETDGYHYTMTIAWQEKDSPSYEDYYSGTLTMVSDTKYLEPGKVYQFDETGMLKLGIDKYASLNEGGADITGIAPDCFIEGGKVLTGLMNAVMNIQHKQMYGTYAEGTVLSKVEKISGNVKRIYMGIALIVFPIIFGIIFFGMTRRYNSTTSKILPDTFNMMYNFKNVICVIIILALVATGIYMLVKEKRRNKE